MSLTGRRSASPVLIQRVRATLGYVGRAELRSATGARTSELRVAPWQGDLLVLAPRPNPLSSDLHDPCLEVAACARVFEGPDGGGGPTAPIATVDDWVVVAFFGWLSQVDPAQLSGAVEAFADRHPTADLLGLGGGWDLLTLDVVEALVSGCGDIASLERGAACALLAA